MDGLKLLGRSEDELENEIKIENAISKEVNMNFGLQICAIIYLKMVGPKANFIKDGHL